MKTAATLAIAAGALMTMTAAAVATPLTPAMVQPVAITADHDAGVMLASSTRNSPLTPRTKLVPDQGSVAINPLLDPALHTPPRR